MCVAIRSRNQRSCEMTSTEPANSSSASSSARSVSTSRSLDGSSSSSTFAPERSIFARCSRPRSPPVGQLSGGERGRLHLAKMLRSGANVLLLDEPSNDLDVETLRALEEALLEFAGCVLVISHDRWFLDRIATHILAFEGESQAVFFNGNYQEYEADKRKRLGEEAAKPHRIKYKALK